MQANPLWPVKIRFPKLESDASTDITVVGGGITGISCAYYLHNAGYDVIVIEQDEVGSAASGASSGILYYGSGTNFVEAIHLMGKQNASILWRESRETLEAIAGLVEKNNIECGFRRPGAIMVARNGGEVGYIQREHEALRDVGIDTEILVGSDLESYYRGREFHSGLHFTECSQIRPAVFSAALAAASNLKVFEHTPYNSFQQANGGSVVKTPNAKIRTNKILFATNLRPLFGLEKFIERESSVIIASEPLPEEQLTETWVDEKLIWTIGEHYDIIYPAENRLMLELYRYEDVEEKISLYYLRHFSQDQVWGEDWAKTRDWNPIIGQVRENIYVAVAMGDQGVIMGHTAGRKMPVLLEGKDDGFLALCSTRRLA